SRAPDDPAESRPEVVALVPARNEAATIQRCAAALNAQDYAGAFRVVVIDDASTDGTADLARGGGARVEVIAAPALAPGWSGKLWALQAGVAHLEREGHAPAFLWLTDADVVHAPHTLTQLVDKAESAKRDL